MSVFCSDCGCEYDITLFQYGRTIECTCGNRVGRELKVLSLNTPATADQLKFMVDVMLDRLARWLRVIGSDAACREGIEDEDLVRYAIDENRIVLTRDRALPTEWWIDNYLLIDSVRPMEQLHQVVTHFNLPWQRSLFTRCTVCNEPLHPLKQDQIAGRVPVKVLDFAARFAGCPSCDRIYWDGSHVDRMREKLKEALQKAEPSRY